MRKIIVLISILLLVFSAFAEEKIVFSKEAQDAIDYLEMNGIEYEIVYESLKEFPEEIKEFNIENIQTFLSSVSGAKSSLTHVLYAFAGIEDPYKMPKGSRLVLAGGLDADGYDGFLYKWERFAPHPFPLWFSVTQSKFCPGGSGTTIVGECDEPNTTTALKIATFSEYTARSACDNGVQVTFRLGVNLYSWSQTMVYVPGSGWTWVNIRVYAGWIYAINDGNGEPYAPTTDLCSTPAMLYNLCPYVN
ncbi:MAG: hypothetical protein ACOX2F_06235 [bacterium]